MPWGTNRIRRYHSETPELFGSQQLFTATDAIGFSYGVSWNMSYDQTVWNYMIVHELLHFSVPNHGKLWKSLMRAHLSDYAAAEDKLNLRHSSAS